MVGTHHNARIACCDVYRTFIQGLPQYFNYYSYLYYWFEFLIFSLPFWLLMAFLLPLLTKYFRIGVQLFRRQHCQSVTSAYCKRRLSANLTTRLPYSKSLDGLYMAQTNVHIIMRVAYAVTCTVHFFNVYASTFFSIVYKHSVRVEGIIGFDNSNMGYT